MDNETPGSGAHRLLAENLKLHERVFELEGKLQQYTDASDRSSTRILNVRKLLEQKDVTLEQYTRELGEKQAELQGMVEDLKKRNEQLQLWRDTLRIYQELFEQSGEGRIMVSRDGKIVLYNLMAEEMLGEKIREAIYKPIEDADFSSFDPGTAAMVREAMEKHRLVEWSMTVGGRRVTTTTFPVGTEDDLRGAMLKIAIAGEK